MLGYTLHDVVQTPGVGELLIAKAGDGAPVRIAVADPDGHQAMAADSEHRPAGELLRRIRETHGRLEPLVGKKGVAVRAHRVGTTHTILRFDDQLLVTLHLYGTPGFQAPLLQLHRRRDFGMFDQFVKHFEDVWAVARPIGDKPTESTEQPGDELLDSLDYTWRPSS